MAAEAERIAREGIDPELWERLKKSSYGNRVRALNSFEHICISQAQSFFQGCDFLRFPEVYDSLTREDAQAHDRPLGHAGAHRPVRGPAQRGSGGMTNIVTFPGLGLEFHLDRVAFSLFGHPVYWYGVIIGCGFLLAVLLCCGGRPDSA